MRSWQPGSTSTPCMCTSSWSRRRSSPSECGTGRRLLPGRPPAQGCKLRSCNVHWSSADLVKSLEVQHLTSQKLHPTNCPINWQQSIHTYQACLTSLTLCTACLICASPLPVNLGWGNLQPGFKSLRHLHLRLSLQHYSSAILVVYTGLDARHMTCLSALFSCLPVGCGCLCFVTQDMAPHGRLTPARVT